MRTFDYSFLSNIVVNSNILQTTNIIHSLRADAENKKLAHKAIFDSLVSVAKVRSVMASNAVEGIVSTDKRITEIVNNHSEPLNHDEKEIAGYRDALKIIHENHDIVHFVERDILSLHSVLLSLAESPYRGKYKQHDNIVIAINEKGEKSVRFHPLSALETKQAMEQLVLAYADASSNTSISPLLLIPCVILDFLCIHPFMDGNGRMSRLLSLLLLYQYGYDVGKYISFEATINNHRDAYYNSLQQSSHGWKENRNDYMPFIQNFIESLLICYQELEKRFVSITNGKSSKEKRVESVVMNNLLPISKKELMDLLPDVSVSTIERVLAQMLKEGKIHKLGSFKNARYKRKLKT
ncbi:MAG: Fic family protein [Erysipelotrichia bacterium]|jgi:Fic family protein|nr:Fic family protein [Bacilli bacterium]MDD4005735.1 Fic family protein [Bacilli bacterium]NMV82406.1 Fic family protein [Erysipelotrichia bacterium]